jgi:ABC-type oligopeptide transport system substrate-binding subunit
MSRKLLRAAIAGSALLATLALAACSGTGPDTDANRDAPPNPTSQPAPDQVPDEQDRLGPGRNLTGTFDYLVPKGQEPMPLVFTFNPSHPMYDAADPDSAHADATFVGSA